MTPEEGNLPDEPVAGEVKDYHEWRTDHSYRAWGDETPGGAGVARQDGVDLVWRMIPGHTAVVAGAEIARLAKECAEKDARMAELEAELDEQDKLIAIQGDALSRWPGANRESRDREAAKRKLVEAWDALYAKFLRSGGVCRLERWEAVVAARASLARLSGEEKP